MLRLRCACVLLLSVSLVRADAKVQSRGESRRGAQLPLTTTSIQARKDFARAMQNLEQYRPKETLQYLRASVQDDPQFAQALILVAQLSPDPEEQSAARHRAKQLLPGVSPGEQLLIRWIAGAQENDYLPAIAAMNDLLSQYPQDPRIAFLAGRWLIEQQRYEQAVTILEHAVALTPDYPAALNDLAYAYAYSGDFEKAFAAMEDYIALAPDQPNPHDSYGELLRMDGKFEAALEQYRLSIRIDPNFGSELGVADTYALMGREEEAREEYDRAIVFAASESDRIQYELQSAVTWIREGSPKQAEKALTEVAKHARAAGLARLEAEADRVLAMSEADAKPALKHLQAAQKVLQQSRDLSQSDRNEEVARILRVKAWRLAEEGQMDSAHEAVQQLGAMADGKSRIVMLCYQGAAGAVLATEGKSAEAIPYLEEDSTDPVSMRLLWKAYSATGAAQQARLLALRLSALNVPTVEQALVVPQFRASLVSQAGQP